MTESMRRNDAIVIGAGHNGLACASFLARAGLNVVILEATDSAGGMAAPRRLGTDYHFPGLAHIAHPVGGEVRRELQLDRFGYVPGEPMDTVSLGADGHHVVAGAESVDGVAASDASAYRTFRQQYLEFARAIAPLFDNRPPRLKDMPFGDKATLAKLGWNLRFGLGRDTMYEFLRVVGINIYDVVNETFDDEQLKALIAHDAAMGSAMGPRSPGTVLTWLQRLHGELNGPPHSQAGSKLIHALTQSAEDAGVEIRFGARVASVLIENDKAFGVELDNGDMIKAPLVMSSVDPRTTFGTLVGAPRLDTMFATRARQIRGSGVVGKLNIALRGLPNFAGLDSDKLRHRLIVAPSMRYIEHAFNHSKYRECSKKPVFEISIPSLYDPALAPEGHHVMSVNVSYLPYDLQDGWPDQRKTLAYRLISQLGEYAPNLTSLIVDHEFLSPADVEREYGAVHGHWHHGELTMHQSFMLRPLYGAAQYETPVTGLFLCGAGCHPGGGLTGRPGINAAKRAIDTGAAK